MVAIEHDPPREVVGGGAGLLGMKQDGVAGGDAEKPHD